MGDKDEHFVFEGFDAPSYTPVPDAVFDVLLKRLGNAELKVLMYVIRRTFGFKKGSDRISKSQLENGIITRGGKILDEGTGLSRRAIRISVQSLVDKQILLKRSWSSPEKGFETAEYALNVKGSDPWVLSTQAMGTKVPKGLGREVPIQETDVQETVLQDHVNVALNKNGATLAGETSLDPRIQDVITRMGERLGDGKAGSRVAFERILNVLGEPITERLVGNTLEMYREGKISSTRAKYFMGMAKKVAKEAGKDLGFKSKGSATSGLTAPEETAMRTQIATMTAEIASEMNGNGRGEPMPAQGEQALTHMFEAYQRRHRSREV